MPEKAYETEAEPERLHVETTTLSPISSDTENTFRPFVPVDVTLRELTPLSLIFGVALGLIIGASSLYLILKIGFTISGTTIVIAASSITLFRILSKLGLRNPSILEHNIAQSAGSAGDAIGFGMGITLPAIIILGFNLEISYAILTSVIGAVLGILLMVPLRRQFIVAMHGQLKYPEGIACARMAETLVDKGGRTILFGFVFSFIYSVLTDVFRIWRGFAEKIVGFPYRNAAFSIELSPVLLGVGYMIGPRAASTMCAGGLFAAGVLTPLISFFASGVDHPISPQQAFLVRDMDPYQLRNSYLLYIGAGSVAASGIFTLFRSAPAIWQSLLAGYADLRDSKGWRSKENRTNQDLSMKVLVSGVATLLCVALLVRFLGLQFNALGGLLIIVLGFIYVSVSARLTGELGTTSTPLTAFAIGSLLLTCVVFLAVGWTGPSYYLTALSIGTIIGIAVSTGGISSQVLKTGFLLGATPRHQQVAILVGAIIAALVLGPLLVRLNDSNTIYVPPVTFIPVSSDLESLNLNLQLNSLKEFSEETVPPKADAYRILSVNPRDNSALQNVPYGEYLINKSGKLVYELKRNFPSDLQTDPKQLGSYETLKGVQGQTDHNVYRIWQNQGSNDSPPGSYLVNDAGRAVYLVDPGINGSHTMRPDGSRVEKFDAPKAVLMAYIIKATLLGQLQWILVLLGVMITVVLELCHVSSLVFAVGLYLPLSSSVPIFFGAMILKLVNYLQRRAKPNDGPAYGEEQSPGVLMSSGYIAGGAIASILTSVLAGAFTEFFNRIDEWARKHNVIYSGPNADSFSLIPFTLMILLLFIVAKSVSPSVTTPDQSNTEL